MTRRSRILLVVPVVLLLAGLLSSCQRPVLTTTTYATGFNRPWDLAFLPDGTLLVTERPGRISKVVGGTRIQVAAVADTFALGETGMEGLAVDPDFATNRRIYVCTGSTAGGSPDIRVVRWELDAGVTALLDRTDIVTGMPVNTVGGRHGGCRPRFGPDGYLWITTGDSGSPTVPQDPTSLGGKVLRVDTDGNPAPGNPGGALDPRIYTYGHRNPQGLAFRPRDGVPFEVEHGTGCDDEVNILVAGGNYGWDPDDGSGTYVESGTPMTDLVTFPDAVAAEWSSGCPTIAPSGATFITGNQWQGYDGSLAIAVLKDTHLRIQHHRSDGSVLEWIELDDGVRLRSVVQGPDGDLYVATDSFTGVILRVAPGAP